MRLRSIQGCGCAVGNDVQPIKGVGTVSGILLFRRLLVETEQREIIALSVKALLANPCLCQSSVAFRGPNTINSESAIWLNVDSKATNLDPLNPQTLNSDHR